jgi:hypothetical protein
MATRKDPGGGKKPPRKPVTSVAKPKAKVTKSRGSKTAKQVGDMNQLEGYRTKNRYNDGSKISQAQINKGFKAVKAAGKNALGTEMGLADNIKRRKQQRAGGKGK